MKRKLLILIIALLLASCGDKEYSAVETDYPKSPAYTKEEVLHSYFDSIEECADSDVAYISLSTTDQGYIGVSLKEGVEDRIKLRITKGENKYTYDIDKTEMVAFPLNMGNGTYSILLYQNLHDSEYALVYSNNINVKLEEPNISYLYPNQVVDYDKSDMVIDKSFEVTKNDEDDLNRAYHLYSYVVDRLSYDYNKAEEVRSAYTLPNIEEAIEKRKGICFDYASLLSALCRCQHIPARVIVGYTDLGYHAWVEIYLENEGWINPRFFFNGDEWSLVDPTLDDSGADYEGAYDEVYHY